MTTRATGQRCLTAWRTLVQHSHLPPLTKLVCVNLSLHMEDMTGSRSPSLREQMRDTGLSYELLMQNLRTALREGYLASAAVEGSSGAFSTVVYRATFPGSGSAQPERSETAPPAASPLNDEGVAIWANLSGGRLH